MDILDVAQMSKADQLAASAGTPTFILMQRAGRAVADAAFAMAGQGSILVVAGRGNNGGDGFIAAAELAHRGCDVRIMLLCDRATLKGDAARASSQWTGVVMPCNPALIDQPSLIVDALFGAGLDRDVKGDPLAIVEAINASAVPVLSVDLPSGINGDTGEVMGVAVRATRTVTFFRKKPAHLLVPGRVHCGDVVVADIGIDGSVLHEIKPRAFENAPALWRGSFPFPGVEAHKYSRGHAVVVSGELASTGAARLAARASLRAGAGLVTLTSPNQALAVNAAALTAVMIRSVDTAEQFAELLSDKRLNVCVIGPGAGIGQRTRDFVLAALEAKRALVLDADALTSFADDPQALFEAIKASESHVVLTPHQGEFHRLFRAVMTIDEPASKLEKTRLAALMSGATVLLKGPDTVVASPDGRASIAANAPPWLATAGAGDVLSGMIGGFLAQGVEAFESASIGVWTHGEAARAFGPGLISEDISESLPGVFRRLYNEFGVAD